MRTLSSILVPLAFAAGVASASTFPWSSASATPSPVQDEGKEEAQDETLDSDSPFFDARRAELVRRQAEIQGAWMLVHFETSAHFFDPSDFRGFAMLQDGYMTLLFQGKERVVGILGPHEEYTIQATAYRYRFNERGALQLASIMGFASSGEDLELEFDRADSTAEYDVRLLGDSLSLSRLGGSSFEFRRVRETPFPADALDALRRGESYFGDEEE